MRNLIAPFCLALSSACSAGLVSTDVQLALDAPAAACGADAAACTPDDVSGRMYAATAIWGAGAEATPLALLGGDAAVLLDPSAGMGASTSFSLADGLSAGSLMAAPAAGDGAREIERIELLVDYLDVTVTLDDDSPLAGTWVLRTVLADAVTAPDVQGEMLRGDVLVKRAEDRTFWWCDKDACSPSLDALAAAPTGDRDLAEADGGFTDNPHYTPVTVLLSEPLSVSAAELATEGSAWRVTLDVTDALALHAAPADLDGAAQLVAAATLTDADGALVLPGSAEFIPGE